MTRYKAKNTTSKWKSQTGYTLEMWAEMQGVSRQMIEKRFAKYGTCIDSEIKRIQQQQQKEKFDNIRMRMLKGEPVSRYYRKLVNNYDEV
jgi:hypothetical protein